MDFSVNVESLYNVIKNLKSSNDEIDGLIQSFSSLDVNKIEGLSSASVFLNDKSKLNEISSNFKTMNNRINEVKDKMCAADANVASYFNYMNQIDEIFGEEMEEIYAIEDIEERQRRMDELIVHYNDYIDEMNDEYKTIHSELEYWKDRKNTHILTDAETVECDKKIEELEKQKSELAIVITFYGEVRNLVVDEKYNLYLERDDFNSNLGSNIAKSEILTYNFPSEIGGNYVPITLYYDANGNLIHPSSMEKAMYLYSNGINMPMDGETMRYYNEFFPYLTENEKNIISYLYNTEGVDAAQEYINFKWDKAARTAGAESAAEIASQINEIRSNNTADGALVYALLIKHGFIGGVENFGDGLYNFFNADGKVSSNQYETMFISRYLQTIYDDDTLNRILTTGTYEISTSIGNMAPAILASVVTANPGVGRALMGLSTTGNAREDGLQNGKTELQAWMYGALSGISEVTLEKFLGGIPGLGGNTASRSMLMNMLSEGGEESIQEVLGVIFNNMTGTETELDLKAVGKSGIYGFITAGLLNGGQITINGVVHTFTPENVAKLLNKYKGNDHWFDRHKLSDEEVEKMFAELKVPELALEHSITEMFNQENDLVIDAIETHLKNKGIISNVKNNDQTIYLLYREKPELFENQEFMIELLRYDWRYIRYDKTDAKEVYKVFCAEFLKTRYGYGWHRTELVQRLVDELDNPRVAATGTYKIPHKFLFEEIRKKTIIQIENNCSYFDIDPISDAVKSYFIQDCIYPLEYGKKMEELYLTPNINLYYAGLNYQEDSSVFKDGYEVNYGGKLSYNFWNVHSIGNSFMSFLSPGQYGRNSTIIVAIPNDCRDYLGSDGEVGDYHIFHKKDIPKTYLLPEYIVGVATKIDETPVFIPKTIKSTERKQYKNYGEAVIDNFKYAEEMLSVISEKF